MVLDLLESLAGSQELDLPGGVRVTREYDRLAFERAGGREAPAEAWLQCVIALKGATALPELGIELHVEERMLTPEERSACLAGRADRAEAEEWIDADRVTPPLIARSWRPGDRFTPLGAGGQKKVSDFLTDAKVPQEQRRRTVLLCDQAGPVWLVPLRIEDRVRVTDTTRRVLRLRVRSLTGDA
jgi:tRNA(Ile)-lysidine synthase